MHRPTQAPYSRQYMSLICTHDEAQAAEAQAAVARAEARLGAPVHTEIQPLRRFWLAEDYHQKYWLRSHDRLMALLRGRHPTLEAFLAAPEVSWLNAVLSRELTVGQLERRLAEAGVQGAEALVQAARGARYGAA